MPSPLNLYVSSNGTDHGPLTLEEATKRVASGEFKPDDLSWHQGVSGWVPLKNLPEWNQLNKKSAPPPLLEKKVSSTIPTSKISNSGKQTGSPSNKTNIKNRQISNNSTSFEDTSETKSSIGILGKIMIAFAILTFLSTLGVVGFLIYKNLDKFIPDQDIQTNEVPSEAQEPLSENNQTDDVENVEEPSLLEPDPFAPPE